MAPKTAQTLLFIYILMPTSLELRGHVDNLHFHLLDNILIVLPPVPINPQTQPQAAP